MEHDNLDTEINKNVVKQVFAVDFKALKFCLARCNINVTIATVLYRQYINDGDRCTSMA